jgi:branched-chain amino acid transport system substrate-binding protein
MKAMRPRQERKLPERRCPVTRNESRAFRLRSTVIGLALAVAAGGIAAAQAPDIKVGVFGPLTGPAAADGNGCLYATQLAGDQANAKGGINGRKVTIVSADDQAKPSEGIAAVQKLVSRDGAIAVVSCSYSGATRSAAPVAQQAKVPMVVAYAVHPDITRAGEYAWRIFSLGPVQGHAIAVMAREDGKAGRAAVLWAKNDYGESISTAATQRFTALGGQVVLSEPFALGDKDFTTLLTKVRAATPDVLLVVGYYNEGALLVQQARRLGLTMPVYASDGLSAPKFVELAGTAAEGVVVSAATDLTSSLFKAFAQEFEARHKYVPDSVPSHGYDAMLVVLEALRRGGASADGVLKGLGEMKEFTGVNGTIVFTPEREIRTDQSFWKIQGGRFTQYKLVPYDRVK